MVICLFFFGNHILLFKGFFYEIYSVLVSATAVGCEVRPDFVWPDHCSSHHQIIQQLISFKCQKCSHDTVYRKSSYFLYLFIVFFLKYKFDVLPCPASISKAAVYSIILCKNCRPMVH